MGPQPSPPSAPSPPPRLPPTRLAAPLPLLQAAPAPPPAHPPPDPPQEEAAPLPPQPAAPPSQPKPAQPTILDLLNRLRWDPALDPADYVLGYWDRVAEEILEAELARVDWEASDKFALRLREEASAEGEEGAEAGAGEAIGEAASTDEGSTKLSREEGEWSPGRGGSRWRTIPLHRIRRVWRGEELVWSRTGPEGRTPLA